MLRLGHSWAWTPVAVSANKHATSAEANLMDQHEGLTYERDAVRREPFALRSSFLVNELTDDLSIEMVRKIQNRYGVEIWPWERTR